MAANLVSPRPVWLVPGVRTPFTKVDGGLRSLDAVALSVPVAKAMAAQLAPGTRPDLVAWGTVASNLGWSNLAREVLVDAGMDGRTPAFSTVLACSTSMVAAFECAGMLGGDLHLAMAGGVESMSRVQIALSQGLSDWLRRLTQARTLGERIDRFLAIRWADVRLHVPRLDEVAGELLVEAENLAGNERQVAYRFAVREEAGQPLVEGRVTVVLDTALPA